MYSGHPIVSISVGASCIFKLGKDGPDQKISGACEEKNGWWVSVVPIDRVSKRAKWTRGGVPDGEKAEAEAFVRAMWDLIKDWDSSYRFIHASQGFEVSGFGDEDHIHFLWKENDLQIFDNGAILGLDFFSKYNCASLKRDCWGHLGDVGMWVSYAESGAN